jgi:hypothetical protein
MSNLTTPSLSDEELNTLTQDKVALITRTQKELVPLLVERIVRRVQSDFPTATHIILSTEEDKDLYGVTGSVLALDVVVFEGGDAGDDDFSDDLYEDLYEDLDRLADCTGAGGRTIDVEIRSY